MPDHEPFERNWVLLPDGTWAPVCFSDRTDPASLMLPGSQVWRCRVEPVEQIQ